MKKRTTKEEVDQLRKFAARVRLRRNELKISQLELAELMDCHVNAISKIERVLSDPSLVTALRIAKALKTSLKELLPD